MIDRWAAQSEVIAEWNDLAPELISLNQQSALADTNETWQILRTECADLSDELGYRQKLAWPASFLRGDPWELSLLQRMCSITTACQKAFLNLSRDCSTLSHAFAGLKGPLGSLRKLVERAMSLQYKDQGWVPSLLAVLPDLAGVDRKSFFDSLNQSLSEDLLKTLESIATADRGGSWDMAGRLGVAALAIIALDGAGPPAPDWKAVLEWLKLLVGNSNCQMCLFCQQNADDSNVRRTFEGLVDLVVSDKVQEPHVEETGLVAVLSNGLRIELRRTKELRPSPNARVMKVLDEVTHYFEQPKTPDTDVVKLSKGLAAAWRSHSDLASWWQQAKLPERGELWALVQRLVPVEPGDILATVTAWCVS